MSPALDGDVDYSGKISGSRTGIGWLTARKPAADPRDPAPGPPPDSRHRHGDRPPPGLRTPGPAGTQEPAAAAGALLRATRAERGPPDGAVVPFLPPSTGSERLYPKKRKAPERPDVSGEGNPVLDAGQDMLRRARAVGT